MWLLAAGRVQVSTRLSFWNQRLLGETLSSSSMAEARGGGVEASARAASACPLWQEHVTSPHALGQSK